MIVLDASAWARSLAVDDEASDAARDFMTRYPRWLMPPHGPVETLRTIRRFEQAEFLSPTEAEECMTALTLAEVTLIQPEPWLLRTMWSLRHNISPYDAAYVAIALRFKHPLLTFDKRLARTAKALGVEVEAPQ